MGGSIGFHGKVPSRGDFVQQGLPDVFVEKWDQWLQESIAHSKGALGGNWLDLYLTSPIWRFVVSPGVFDDQLWCGAVMPSVDRVNRYFPLTIAASFDGSSSVFAASAACLSWFNNIEALLLRALDDDALDINVFATAVTQQAVPDWIPVEQAGEMKVSSTGEAQFALLPGFDPMLRCPELLEDYYRRQFGAFSLWWTNGSERLVGQGRIYDHLPDPTRYVELLGDAG